MNKKQKKVLIRIIAAAVLMILFSLLPIEGYLAFGLFMIPYLIIGYDILKKAVKGILNRQVFDENFLMAVALCCFIRSVSCSRAMQWERAVRISVN